ncbi:MAG TPA: YeeE/YedE family protein [Thermodesulfatator atlanticus]|uniref:YeeE/YedE family protein n=1 Tax=Thermodesulfatator atlanticus TaxID=501497 RepID=A0A7V5NYM0_9BACT|nr:YeeE/YedE family protein [Thermodesulfatator atlanticus]
MNKGWSPYLGGFLTGILLIVSVVVTQKFLGKPHYLGTSTAYVRVAGLLEKAVNQGSEALSYYQKYQPRVDWKVALVFFGVPLGAFLAAVKNGEFYAHLIPARWKESFGPRPALRAFTAFLGGFLIVYGARLAGGCPSGHGLSGMSQLSLSGFITVAGFFIGGIPLALILYRRRK